MLISPAYAQAAGGGSDMLVSLLPFVLIFVIMYFLILRPQQRRVKQHQEMVKNVRRGDTIVTSGGMVAKVTSRWRLPMACGCGRCGRWCPTFAPRASR
jgi:preprotein translocase subunit YajC